MRVRAARRGVAIGWAVAALLGCGSGGDGATDPLAGVASCDQATEALAAVVETERTAHLGCSTAADCSGVWARIDRGDTSCVDHGCRWAVAGASAGAFASFLATDPGITALCGYLRDNACQRLVADCFPDEPVCQGGRCALQRADRSRG